MIKMDWVLLCLLINLNCCFASKNIEGSNVGLTKTSEYLIDCFLNERDNRHLDFTESVILMTFEENEDDRMLVINDANREPYDNLDGCLHSRYGKFLIIIDGIPDDLFINPEGVNKKILKKELKKRRSKNKKMYKKIAMGKYKGEIPIYSEYDPFVYYYIIYKNVEILETTPSYLKVEIQNR